MPRARKRSNTPLGSRARRGRPSESQSRPLIAPRLTRERERERERGAAKVPAGSEASSREDLSPPPSFFLTVLSSCLPARTHREIVRRLFPIIRNLELTRG